MPRVCHMFKSKRSFNICKGKARKKAKRNTTPVLAVKTLAFTRCTRENEYHRRNRNWGRGQR